MKLLKNCEIIATIAGNSSGALCGRNETKKKIVEKEKH